MEELTVKPWRAPGKERLYVNKPGVRGASVAWLDCRTGVVTLEKLALEDAALEAAALAKIEAWCQASGREIPPRTVRRQATTQPPQRTQPSRPTKPAKPPAPPASVPFLPPMRAEDDLARNLPGAGLESLVREGEQKYKLPVRLVAKLFGDQLGDSATLRGLEGERIVGAALAPLKAVGWKVLHGIPLPSGSDIDHLVVGPPGVFTVNSKHHAGAAVWVGDNTVKVNRNGYPYLANSEFEAARTAKLLTQWCGFDVPVHPVIAMVGVRKITRTGSPAVAVIAGDEIASSLAAWPAVLSPNQVDRTYTIARHAYVWSQVGKGGKAKAQ
ncbi:nuclease-related domain-containing protein [Kitasatospora kifunensis]|uniref:NERD domain-containing protein n=1 Tax=Kitasatospora kifunensis TaxID=58351 RepID=A0A7W7R434_KITKI|nr:nuclease-related domain-containing protein [Kitasatospora kifunensis]MBB4925011.1 hypothetical protein [Kitasatospora kifunensis]